MPRTVEPERTGSSGNDGRSRSDSQSLGTRSANHRPSRKLDQLTVGQPASIECRACPPMDPIHCPDRLDVNASGTTRSRGVPTSD